MGINDDINKNEEIKKYNRKFNQKNNNNKDSQV
jgi:hypothetical protein